MGGWISSGGTTSSGEKPDVRNIKTVVEYCYQKSVTVELVSPEIANKLEGSTFKVPDINASDEASMAKASKSGFKIYIEVENPEKMVKELEAVLQEACECLKVDYHRIGISGDEIIGTNQDVGPTLGNVINILKARAENLRRSKQIVPRAVETLLAKNNIKLDADDTELYIESDISEKIISTELPTEVPETNKDYSFQFIDGCSVLLNSETEEISGKFHTLSLEKYIEDLTAVRNLKKSTICTSFSKMRLGIREESFNLHKACNAQKELDEQSQINGIDFMSVHKVDTHSHAVSFFTANELASFIKRILAAHEDHVNNNNANPCSNYCAEFTKEGIKAFTVNADSLKVKTDFQCRGNFGLFEERFRPFGKKIFQEIFLKWDNLDDGKWLALLLKEKIKKLDKYENVELGISIYGYSPYEIKRLADWCINNHLFGPNIRWKLQLKPKLPKGKLANLGEQYKNIFLPMMEATRDPGSNKNLFHFMQFISAFDIVGDEERHENCSNETLRIKPEDWMDESYVPFIYYLYYIHNNLSMLNQFRRDRKFNTFSLVPHCGEAGSSDHYSAAFLLAHGISHGLTLADVPVYNYLFYIGCVPVGFSCQSNNELIKKAAELKFNKLFKIGLLVYPTTDDRLMFFLMENELLTEYSFDKSIFSFTSVDTSMMARNSVVGSAFPEKMKQVMLGMKFANCGIESNDVGKSNCPHIAYCFRQDAYLNEGRLLTALATFAD